MGGTARRLRHGVDGIARGPRQWREDRQALGQGARRLRHGVDGIARGLRQWREDRQALGQGARRGGQRERRANDHREQRGQATPARASPSEDCAHELPAVTSGRALPARPGSADRIRARDGKARA